MLAIGESISLVPLFSDKKDTYKSKIYEMKDDVLYIDYPSNEATNRTEYFFDGTQFKVSFVDKEKVVYTFRTELLGRKIEKIPVLIITAPKNEDVHKVQRREYVRVETMVDVSVDIIANSDPAFNSVIVDMSAGGMLLSLPIGHKVAKGDVLDCLVVLPMRSGEKVYLDLECSVLRILDGDNNRQRAPLQFNQITARDRQHIIRFCFEQQLQMKKKEMKI
ncbi:flagellar brake domain-containing protein [Bacillus sp. NEB1478]|uniref:flagellar brake protein n=1 Tax=Bacillus sp. NEB1478 TaxID=3073816 RepID=UPI0028731BF5|nr:flagellar brake domain-containing protein [Bacillus sp. NEB1478]WNB93704.1 flagellar brake domain-containing protein [Bacillus sp. NEB1478]